MHKIQVAIQAGRFLSGLLMAALLIAGPARAEEAAGKAGAVPATETAATQAVAAQIDDPVKVVERFHDALSRAMQNAQALGFEGRREILAPAVAATFDAPAMVRIATGRYWGRFTEEQRDQLIDAFRRMTIAAYAGRFNDYSGQRFEVLGTQQGRRGRVLVKTRLIKGNGEAVRFNYLLRRKGDQWVILDIYLDGTFSELAVRRSEFASVLKDKGYDGLIAAIEDKIAGYRKS